MVLPGQVASCMWLGEAARVAASMQEDGPGGPEWFIPIRSGFDSQSCHQHNAKGVKRMLAHAEDAAMFMGLVIITFGALVYASRILFRSRD